MRKLLCVLSFLLATQTYAQTYDIVLRNGRVLDPESGLDGIRNVGIAGKKIAAVSTQPLRGKVEIDASGLVVAPGFIDLHSHGQTLENYRYKAMDGVTTALELEVGVSPVREWYASREGKSPIHFGASSGHIPARMAVMKDTGGLLPQDAAMNRPATLEEQKVTLDAVQKGMDDGGLGMGMGITYTPTATPDEILDLFYLAARYKRPVFVHMRGGNVIASLQEVITNAAVTGAPLHVVHINSAATAKTPQALAMIEGARARNLDVTTEAYPYIASMTEITSAAYSNWERQGPEYFSRLLWPITGERLTRESFERYRKQGGMVISFGNTEEMVRAAISHPFVMIASDGLIENGKGHPRGAGTFGRVLGKYSREEKALSLMDAVRKSSLMPAQRLESMSPQMRQKGRIKAGADADISVFDPNRVIDKATFENAAQYSDGFRYVLVEGVFVVRNGKLQDGVAPGQAIRAATLLGQTASGIQGVVAADARPELVQEGFMFTEGPVGTADGGLYFSDIMGADKTYRLDPGGKISLYRSNTNGTNGLALMRDGSLIGAEGNGKRISKAAGGSAVTLTEGIAGMGLMAPNDLIVDAKGGIYFTDPGPRPVVPGRKAYVYYLPIRAGQPRLLDDSIMRPNGLSLTNDGKALIVDDTVGDNVFAFDIETDGSLKNKRSFAKLHDVKPGQESGADGMAIDSQDRIYVTTASGIQVFDRKGAYLGTIRVPRQPANCAFAGPGKPDALHHCARRAVQAEDVVARPWAVG